MLPHLAGVFVHALAVYVRVERVVYGITTGTLDVPSNNSAIEGLRPALC